MANERDAEAAFIEAREQLAAEDAQARADALQREAADAEERRRQAEMDRALETLDALDRDASLYLTLKEEGEAYGHTPIEGPVAEACRVLGLDPDDEDDMPETVGEFVGAVKDGAYEPPDLDAYLDRLNAAQDAARDGKPATLEGIAAEPWDAVTRPIPGDASPELLAAIKEASAHCVEEAHEAMRVVYDDRAKFDTHAEELAAHGVAPDAHEYFEQHHLDALGRYEQLGGHDRGPELLTLEALERDPQTVLTHYLPDDADAALLRRAQDACDTLFQKAGEAFGEGRDVDDAIYAIESKSGEIDDMREALGERGGQGVTLDETQFIKSDHEAETSSYVAAARQGSSALDVEGVEVRADDIMRGKTDARSEATREQDPAQPRHMPGPEADAARPQDQFAKASRAALRTPEDFQRRDLAEVINLLADQIGAKDTPEHSAFKQQQTDIADRITREPDPANRADLRQERDSLAHAYVADLLDNVGSRALGSGDLEGAKDMHELAAIHREIAGGRDGPDGGRDANQPTAESREEFAKDAAAVGRQVLGRSAKTVMVADGPEPTPDGDAARRRIADLTQNIGVQVVPTPVGTMMKTGPQHSFAATETPDALSPTSAGELHDVMADRRRGDSSQRQGREEAALHGGAESNLSPMDRLEARLAGHAAALEKEQAAESVAEAGEGPSRESGQGASRAFGRYASLAL